MDETAASGSTALELLTHPFTLGLLICALFLTCAFLLFTLIKTKFEFSRYKRHLSDKLELEAKTIQTLRNEKDQVGKENENLRIKAAQAGEQPLNKLERELEILARAEKHMMINAPGFAPAWETAKSHSLAEIQEEEAGNTLPKRIFRKFFGTGEIRDVEALDPAVQLPDNSPEAHRAPEESGTASSS